MRLSAVLAPAVVLALVTPGVAAAARPDSESSRRVVVVEPVGPELLGFLSGLFTGACGVPVSVEGTGRATYVTVLDGSGAVAREQNTFRQTFVVTNTATGASFTIKDVGPDRVLYADGKPVTLAQIGRSTTGSGTIGRTVTDLTTGEVVSRSGRTYGDFVEVTCAAIT